ncbi:MAG: TetR/AcrR family transcriptional regulator, partial [bacterium]|nr:TetR/AcrR family transcriptional regulator [bacterium]
PKRVQKEHHTRRTELLDIAQGLFVQNGYDSTPVSAILEAAGVAKGTFYHYFRSKEDLLDALVERMIELILTSMHASINAEGLDGIEKLKAYFRASSQWKANNREALMAVVKPLYSNENLLLRHKMNRRTLEAAVPDLTAIIEQGVREGAFNTKDPLEAAEAILGMGFALRETHAELFLGMEDHPENWDALLKKLDFYQDAVERLLGAPQGSIEWMDEKLMERFRPERVK